MTLQITKREIMRSHAAAVARDLLREIERFKAKRKDWKCDRLSKSESGLTEQDLKPLLAKIAKHARIITPDESPQLYEVLKRFEQNVRLAKAMAGFEMLTKFARSGAV